MTLTPELRDKIIETHTMLTELRHQLIGNGQPGEIPKMKTRVTWLERIAYTGLGGLTVTLWLLQQKVAGMIVTVVPFVPGLK